MSYNLVVVKRDPDEDWDQTLDRVEDSAGLLVALTPEMLRTWESVAVRLLAVGPAFDRFENRGLIELTHAESGLQISLFEAEAGIAVPYGHKGDAARDVMRIASDAADLIREATGWAVWDPQLEREITSGSDLTGDGADSMSEISRVVPDILQKTNPPDDNPRQSPT